MKLPTIFVTMILAVGLTSVAGSTPASAAVFDTGPGSELSITYNARGDFTVRGSNVQADELLFCPAGQEDMWTIAEVIEAGPVVHRLPVAVASIRFHLGGGRNLFLSDSQSCGYDLSTERYDNTLSSFALYGTFPGRRESITTVGNLTVTRNMTVHTGDDSDIMRLVNNTIEGNLSLRLNGGQLDFVSLEANDVAKLAKVSGGTGDNRLDIHGGTYHRFRYLGHSKRDDVTAASGVHLGSDPSIITGNGPDAIGFFGTPSHFGNLAAGLIHVRAGRGEDSLRFQYNGDAPAPPRSYSLRANMGPGDDSALIIRAELQAGDRLDGSANIDGIEWCGNLGGTVLRFEEEGFAGEC